MTCAEQMVDMSLCQAITSYEFTLTAQYGPLQSVQAMKVLKISFHNAIMYVYLYLVKVD